MKSRIILAQTKGNGNSRDNLSAAERLVSKAKRDFYADMVIFPECFMSHYPPETERSIKLAAAEPIDGYFVSCMKDIASRNSLWIVFGIQEKGIGSSDGRSSNTTVILDSQGNIRATYRKTHLYDAFGYKESETIRPGDILFTPIDTPFGRVGIFVCYELRFPEVARQQALQGADILIVPAAWASGENKELHFRTLVTARALENTCFVAACDQAGPECIGKSMVVDPLGITIAEAGDAEELVAAEIDTDRISQVRKSLPSAQNRRPELYTKI